MSDSPAKVERQGIEHVEEDRRHGSEKRVFTLWFGANLTIADYVIGVLCITLFGLSLGQAIPVLLLGNILGGVFVGLTAAMGPSMGFPQMMSSRASFGRFGNYFLGGLNWISTVGWFSVNTILAVIALRVVLPEVDFYLAAAGYVIIQTVIAVYGHDFIHLFEKAMSLVLGLLFLLIFALAAPSLGDAFAYSPPGSSGTLALGALGVALVASFSYLMSWSPYASDYSRYLPSSTSKRKVTLYALAGGAASSFMVEVIGAMVASLTPAQSSSSPFAGLYSFAGSYGALVMATLILGAFAADALNLYTNSLSALVLDIKARRWVTVAAGGVAGFAIAALVGARFELFFEQFLLFLSYWITPWLAVVLVDFYLAGRYSVERVKGAPAFDMKALATYLVAVAFSVPFMNFGFTVSGTFVAYEGPVAVALQGADFSYFVSFLVAAALILVLRRRDYGS